MTTRQWNPRYVAYARARGRSPADQLERDRKVWHGASMCPYILWFKKQKARFREAHPDLIADGRILDGDAFDRFIGVVG